MKFWNIQSVEKASKFVGCVVAVPWNFKLQTRRRHLSDWFCVFFRVRDLSSSPNRLDRILDFFTILFITFELKFSAKSDSSNRFYGFSWLFFLLFIILFDAPLGKISRKNKSSMRSHTIVGMIIAMKEEKVEILCNKIYFVMITDNDRQRIKKNANDSTPISDSCKYFFHLRHSQRRRTTIIFLRSSWGDIDAALFFLLLRDFAKLNFF